MSFNDIFKNSFMNTVSMADLSVSQILTIFGITLLFALYIFFVYRIFTRKTFRSEEHTSELQSQR